MPGSEEELGEGWLEGLWAATDCTAPGWGAGNGRQGRAGQGSAALVDQELIFLKGTTDNMAHCPNQIVTYAHACYSQWREVAKSSLCNKRKHTATHDSSCSPCGLQPSMTGGEGAG